ncbi:MAG: hypothetical protein V3V22_07785 [Methylococcales bacterium]
MKFYICIAIFIIALPQAFAECSVKETLKLAREGFMESEIEKRCDNSQQLPSWLSGMWEEQGQFTEGCGAYNAGCSPWWGDKEFEVNGQSLVVYNVSDAHLYTMKQRHQLNVANVSYDGATLSFTIIRHGESEEIYRLDVSDKNVLRGRVVLKREERYGLPPSTLSGKVKLIKR